ncbi:MAG: GNAT family N-acetyltransferase [Polaromonas sp.]
MTPARLALCAVAEGDFEAMAALRIEAMRESLERLGRFDPERARERLRAGFETTFMHHIVLDRGERIGFVTLRPEGRDALRLDHLYIRPMHQGQGIGAWIMDWIQSRARATGIAVKVTVLKRSDAHRFYERHGFKPEGEDTWDLHYRWLPSGGTL